MSPTAALIARAEERVRRDPDFAAVLETVLDAPTTPEGTLGRSAAAQALNDVRLHSLRDDFTAGALTTAQVQRLLGVASPQAVHARRSRGTLLGETVGATTWFPAWQFDPKHQRVRPDLPRILAALRRFTTDSVAADRIMRLHHEDLGGSIDQALRQGGTPAEAAWVALDDLGF